LTKNKAQACELGSGGLACLSLKTLKSVHLGWLNFFLRGGLPIVCFFYLKKKQATCRLFLPNGGWKIMVDVFFPKNSIFNHFFFYPKHLEKYLDKLIQSFFLKKISNNPKPKIFLSQICVFDAFWWLKILKCNSPNQIEHHAPSSTVLVTVVGINNDFFLLPKYIDFSLIF
jgi:hypothetical protein